MANPLLLPPLSLAYLGDAVYELFVRSRIIELGHVKVNDLHRTAVRYVRARGQANALAALMPTLSPEEQDVVRRGRNAKGHAAPKGSDPAEYAAATSFEALIGYLYLAGRQERLQEVLLAAARFLEEE
ncbi:MAG: Mini-ribonuclease 3 [Mycobacterium leprae]